VIPLFWAKTGDNGTDSYHPLILHLVDVAACADAILEREPKTTRDRIGSILGMPWTRARPWILLTIACHDLGKACPGFQIKWEKANKILLGHGLNIPAGVDVHVHHGYISQIALVLMLLEQGWPEDAAMLVSDAIGCHHGSRANPRKLEYLEGSRKAMGDAGWAEARAIIFGSLMALFKPDGVPAKSTISGPDFMLLAGLTSFADWMGSNETYFKFGDSCDCLDLEEWFDERRLVASIALNSIGWNYRRPLIECRKTFSQAFPQFSARPLQDAMADAVDGITEPCVILVEAPMGEGKTEAAFYAHMELQRKLGHRGLYIALPTKATGNAMFERTLQFLHGFPSDRTLDLQLVHGATLLNDAFQQIVVKNIYDEASNASVAANEWFTNKKRALLSEYGVGTVDQCLLPILPVRHNFVRLWGLANRVIIFDEVHAYDSYTGTLLIHLIGWLLAMGSSVILLSATLPPSFRHKLARLTLSVMPQTEVAYPRLSIFNNGFIDQRHFIADPHRRRTVVLSGIAPEVSAIHDVLVEKLVSGGMGLALVNTVQRAQDLYQCYPEGKDLRHEGKLVGKSLPDGTEVYLFHARYPADSRQAREEMAMHNFGPKGNRVGRKVLIATQVVEQSLDLDFDVMVSDLAPIDLLLQRAGRLWRHDRTREARHQTAPHFIVAGLAGDTPIRFDKLLWWSFVYREDILLRTWVLLRDKDILVIPDDIDDMVCTVYEGDIEIPASIQDRYDKAEIEARGETLAHTNIADQAIIGFSDDASWNDPSRYVKSDEEEPGLNTTLVAQTRLGEQTITAIPIWSGDSLNASSNVTAELSKSLYLRSISISRKAVVMKLMAIGVPEGWKQSPLLRNSVPLRLDENGAWIADTRVLLDDHLGLVYQQEEML